MLVQVKKHHICQKDYIWNPTCSYENGNYLASITDYYSIFHLPFYWLPLHY